MLIRAMSDSAFRHILRGGTYTDRPNSRHRCRNPPRFRFRLHRDPRASRSATDPLQSVAIVRLREGYRHASDGNGRNCLWVTRGIRLLQTPRNPAKLVRK